MFQHIVHSLANRQGLFAYVRTCKTRLDTTTKFMHGCCNIAVQSCYFIIPWPRVLSCMNMAVDLSWWFQQRCSSLFVHQAMNSLFQHAWTSLSTTMFKLASSTMFKPVNNHVQACQLNHVQAGQLNHVQACQQPCSNWPAQPCSSLSTGKNKLCVCTWKLLYRFPLWHHFH